MKKFEIKFNQFQANYPFESLEDIQYNCNETLNSDEIFLVTKSIKAHKQTTLHLLLAKDSYINNNMKEFNKIVKEIKANTIKGISSTYESINEYLESYLYANRLSVEIDEKSQDVRLIFFDDSICNRLFGGDGFRIEWNLNLNKLKKVYKNLLVSIFKGKILL
ncbi:MAG TPA: hypothetical protein PK784_05505 [Tenuifilaceae bacterium]|nr:hypothetical protein [Tenuifilaceae bacterium]HPN21584.1 hypothetical protein [Tenuifilaceae bacterium]